MLISVIVPIYYGKKYIPNILEMLEKNILHANIDLELESIFINDSPNEVICENEISICSKISPILIINKENKGIHYSRVQGLNVASGEYILFLDQDDQIEDNYFESQLRHIGKKDIVVANGIAQYPAYDKLLYRYRLMQWTIKHIWFYLQFDCRIISPGQCLIRKSSIPDIWKNNILNQNGADDYFLWLIMLNQGKKVGINREMLYTHKYTYANASANREEMRGSIEEVLTIMEPMIGSSSVRTVRKRIQGSSTNKITKKLVTIVENINRN